MQKLDILILKFMSIIVAAVSAKAHYLHFSPFYYLRSLNYIVILESLIYMS